MALTSPFEGMTPESLKAEMLERMQERGVEADTREGSYSNILLSEAAYVMWEYAQQLNGYLDIIFPGETSGEYLDLHAEQIGMTRQPGTAAAVKVTFSGADATEIPADTAVCTDSGLRFLTREGAVIAAGTAEVWADAEEEGRAYNVSAGRVTQMAVNLPGVTGVTNKEPGTGGTDRESDADLYARFHERRAAPIASGNANHYVMWAKEVTGVAHALCLPLWNGNGTVKVVIGGADRGAVDQSIVSACDIHIKEQAPIGATVTVTTVVTQPITLAAAVVIAAGYTAEGIKTQLEEATARLLEGLPFAQAQSVPYSRFLACLLQCDGVNDYSAFTVNGGTQAVALSAGTVPTVGNVSVTG